MPETFLRIAKPYAHLNADCSPLTAR